MTVLGGTTTNGLATDGSVNNPQMATLTVTNVVTTVKRYRQRDDRHHTLTAVSVTNAGSYTTAPASPVSVTGGGASGATFSLTMNTSMSTESVSVASVVSPGGGITVSGGAAPAFSI